MSYITEAVVLGAYDSQMDRLNSVIAELDKDRHQEFRKIPEDDLERSAGGIKSFLEPIWVAAFNYFSRSQILEAVMMTWKGPQYGVMILVKSSDAEYDWTVLLAPKTDDEEGY